MLLIAHDNENEEYVSSMCRMFCQGVTAMIGHYDIKAANIFTTTYYVNYKTNLSGHFNGVEDLILIYAIKGTRLLSVCLKKRH